LGRTSQLRLAAISSPAYQHRSAGLAFDTQIFSTALADL